MPACRGHDGTQPSYETQSIDNGEAALALLMAPEGQQFDAVILDLVMPNLDGLGVLARLRQAAIPVPVIVRSDYRRPEEYRCLGTSRCVWRCLEALSLGLSLASGSHPSRDRSYMATGTEEGGSAILRCESSTPTTSATLLMVRLPSDATLAAIGHRSTDPVPLESRIGLDLQAGQPTIIEELPIKPRPSHFPRSQTQGCIGFT